MKLPTILAGLLLAVGLAACCPTPTPPPAPEPTTTTTVQPCGQVVCQEIGCPPICPSGQEPDTPGTIPE